MRKFLDDDGDTWTEQPDGTFILTTSADGYSVGMTERCLDDLRHAYGPLTEVDALPGAEPAVTRAELRTFLGELHDALHPNHLSNEDPLEVVAVFIAKLEG